MKLSIVVNDQDIEADIHPGTLLIDFLRDREFCSDAVLLDARLVNPAITLAAQAHLRQVTTLEALGDPENLHPIQQAFVETGATQSGSSNSVMVLAALELLNQNHDPTELEVRECLTGALGQSIDDGKPAEAILLAATRIRETGQFGIPGYRTQDGEARRQKVGLR
jgi:aerobic-type carbon monoxide dehydrogenase small subunit (CoxS/CutS family)